MSSNDSLNADLTLSSSKTPLAMAPKKKVILCQICNENQFKYKCSKCMVV